MSEVVLVTGAGPGMGTDVTRRSARRRGRGRPLGQESDDLACASRGLPGARSRPLQDARTWQGDGGPLRPPRDSTTLP